MRRGEAAGRIRFQSPSLDAKSISAAFSRRSGRSGSGGAVEDFQQVIAELGAHGAVDLVQLTAEYHLVELGHHLPGAEFAQVTALLARRALGMLPGDRREVLAILDALFQRQAL